MNSYLTKHVCRLPIDSSIFQESNGTKLGGEASKSSIGQTSNASYNMLVKLFMSPRRKRGNTYPPTITPVGIDEEPELIAQPPPPVDTYLFLNCPGAGSQYCT